MVLNSESFKSSDLMYTEYVNKIVKSLDQDDDWDVWFEFYFGDEYDVLINLQKKKISFVNSYFQEAYMYPEKHFENPGIIYKGLYLKGFEFPNTVEDNCENYSNADCINFVKDYILRAFFLRESPEYQYHFFFQDHLICSSDFEVIKKLDFKKLLFEQTEFEDKVIKEIAMNSFKTMIYNNPKKLLEIYFRINKSDSYSLGFPIQIFEYIFGVDFILETIAKFSFDDLDINKNSCLIYSKKDNGDYHIKDLRDYFSSNKGKVSEETFEKLNDFCLSMIFDFNKKKKFYNMNDVFLEFIIRNLGDKNPKNSKCQREREFIMQMMNESLAAISKKENNSVANMIAIHQTFALLQIKK
jgi:hypothetical protein